MLYFSFSNGSFRWFGDMYMYDENPVDNKGNVGGKSYVG